MTTAPTPDPMREALQCAGDYLEACKVNGLPDLGVASQMPFIADVIRMIDAALAAAPQPAVTWHSDSLWSHKPVPADREALVEVIRQVHHVDRDHPEMMALYRAIADALLAAGWRRADQAARDEIAELKAENADLKGLLSEPHRETAAIRLVKSAVQLKAKAEAERDAAYRKGQENMRERAALDVEEWGASFTDVRALAIGNGIATAIRALPIKGGDDAA